MAEKLDIDLNCDVAIAGLGPVGLMTALQLGQRGYNVVGIERWPVPYPLPRAVTFDHEIARILKSIGIDANNDSAIDWHDDHYYWINKDGEKLLEPDWYIPANDGWRNRYWFNQPELEDRLRDMIAKLPNVRLLPGFEFSSVTQDEEKVVIDFYEVTANAGVATRKDGGRVGRVTSKYALGSDGANSFVRKSVGYELTDMNFYYDWLVVDTTPKVMPKYMTAHYQICDPARPTTVVPGGPGRRRWEFMVRPEEDRVEFAKTENVWKLLEPFGLKEGVDKLDRAVMWRFQAKYLENWRAGRIMFAGDAAHLMPPFAGEGMCAGLRDAFNLAWRLDLVLKGLAGNDLIDQWGNERREQAKWYINFSVELGKVICVSDPEEAKKRDDKLKADYAVQSKIGPLPTHAAALGEGTWNSGDKLAGAPIFQGKVSDGVRTALFDEVAGRGWFLITNVNKGEETLSSAQLSRFHAIGGKVVKIGPEGSGADLVDVDGVYSAWMKENGRSHILARPDFYIAGTAQTEQDLHEVFDQIFSKIPANV